MTKKAVKSAPRIAFLIHSFNVGGAEMIVRNLGLALHHQGFQIMILPLRPAPHNQIFDTLYSSSVHIGQPYSQPIRNFVRLWQLRDWVQRQLQEFGADIVHSHGELSDMINALLPTKDFIKIRTTHNERFFGNKVPWSWASVLFENCLTWVGQFNHVICISKKIERQIRYRKKSVIYNALMTHQTNYPKEMSKHRADVRIIGRISAQKAQYAFIDHCRTRFGTLRDLPFNLTLIGKVDDLSHARKIEQESQGCIHFTGLCSNQEELYKQADWVIIPSHYEGLSSVMVEAICHGVPVISMPVSGAEDVLSLRVFGHLVKGYDEMIEFILQTQPWTIPIDRQSSLSELFSIDQASRRHVQLYNSLFMNKGVS